MRIIINIDENLPETEITISCNQLTDEIENIMARKPTDSIRKWIIKAEIKGQDNSPLYPLHK